MAVPVTDFRSNSNDQIAHAVKVLGRSKDRLAVFREIHRGKKKIKTASEIAKGTGLKRKRVLEEGVKLAHKQIVIQTERDGEVAYQRDNQFYAHREEVIAQVKSPTRRNNFPTKYSPKATVRIVQTVPKRLIQTEILRLSSASTLLAESSA